jgi:hypothetical protein
MGERQEQLLSIDVAASSRLVAVGGSGGCLTIGVQSGLPIEQLTANPYGYSTQPELPEVIDDLQYLSLDAPVGNLPLPPQPDAQSRKGLASSWPSALIGKRGQRTVDPQAHLMHDFGLPPPQQISFGSGRPHTPPVHRLRPTHLLRPTHVLPSCAPHTSCPPVPHRDRASLSRAASLTCRPRPRILDAM